MCAFLLDHVILVNSVWTLRLFGNFHDYCMFLPNVGVGDVCAVTLGCCTGFSCTLRARVGVFCLVYDFCFSFSCRNFLTVMLKIEFSLLSWLISLSSIAIINVPLSTTVICCAAYTTTPSSITVRFLCIYV